MTTVRRKLGELLVAAQVIDDFQLKVALTEQKKWGGKLGRTLVDLGYVTETTLVQALARQLRIPAIDLEQEIPSAEAVSFVPILACERHGLMPVTWDLQRRVLQLATFDPTNETLFRDLRLELNAREIVPRVATLTSIDRAIRRHYYGERNELPAPSGPIPLTPFQERVFDMNRPELAPSGPVAMPPPTVLVGPPAPPSEARIGTPRAAMQAAPPAPRPLTQPALSAAALPVPPRPPTPLAMPAVQARPPTPMAGATAMPPRPPTPMASPSSVYTAAAMVAAPRGMPPGRTEDERVLAQLQRLEGLMAAEVRSLRVLVEMLVEKGILDRQAYLDRVKQR